MLEYYIPIDTAMNCYSKRFLLVIAITVPHSVWSLQHNYYDNTYNYLTEVTNHTTMHSSLHSALLSLPSAMWVHQGKQSHHSIPVNVNNPAMVVYTGC